MFFCGIKFHTIVELFIVFAHLRILYLVTFSCWMRCDIKNKIRFKPDQRLGLTVVYEQIWKTVHSVQHWKVWGNVKCAVSLRDAQNYKWKGNCTVKQNKIIWKPLLMGWRWGMQLVSRDCYAIISWRKQIRSCSEVRIILAAQSNWIENDKSRKMIREEDGSHLLYHHRSHLKYVCCWYKW